MKKYLFFISLALIFFFFLVFSGFAGEKIDIEVAKRAAEYHGELLFEKDLKICDHELMYWPSGEEAVYVFMLVDEKDIYPGDVFSSDEAVQGAYLALSGQFDEGFNLMAQPERFMTVIVGASTDMPSFLKAHAGLPEHVLYLKLMENPPYDPYFIYVDLFHTCVGSRTDRGYPYSQVTEIHLEKTVALSELSTEKSDLIPEYAQEFEWGSFLNSGQVQESAALPYFMDLGGVKEGKHELDVREYARANVVGCSPAAFVNCLKYLEGQGEIRTGGKFISELLEWTAICYQTNPDDGGTNPTWIVKGSKLMFKGLGYNSDVSAVIRQDNKPGLFLTKFAREIHAEYPAHLGGGPKGIFKGHSTTGIGYWKQGSHIRLIIHDGWAGKNPVYVKYSGYPAAECQYPIWLHKFHPKGPQNYPEANPKIKAPDLVLWDKANQRWSWKYNLTSENAVKAEIYMSQYEFYDSKGKRYEKIPGERSIPYWMSAQVTFIKPLVKRGKVKCKYFAVDYNGHLLEAEKTVLLEDIIGTWKMNYKWKDIGSGTVIWTINANGTFTSSSGSSGTWNLKNKNVTLKYQTGQNPIYSGKIKDNKYSFMSGTMKTTVGQAHSGTWDASRQSDGLKLEDQDEMPRITGSSSDAGVRKK